ncbi:MAG TPA: cytochrome C oxidase subunit IV family protein [Acidimicrobiia bacterium]|nr:cytochrome C oxidase subunit IV family protein [Acidimicrobiia bacterium]
MSTETHDHHPTPAQYWKIAAFLAVLTAIEVSLFYIDHALELGVFNALALLSLSAIKFLVVVGWFMHVRFEKPLISRFFTAGFILACSLYLVVLAALGVVAIRG